HVAHAVNLHDAAQRLALRLEPVAHPLVLVGNRQPLDAALRSSAEFRSLHKAVPQPLRIDHKIGFGCHETMCSSISVNLLAHDGDSLLIDRSSIPTLYRAEIALSR